MKKFVLSMILFQSATSFGDYLPDLPTRALPMEDSSAKLSVQETKDGKIWIAEVDTEVTVKENLADGGMGSNLFSTICDLADMGVVGRISIMLPVRIFPYGSASLEKVISQPIVNSPKIVFVNDVEVEFLPGAKSTNPTIVQRQGTPQQITSWVRQSVLYASKSAATPEIDLKHLNVFACDYFRGKAVVHIWTRISLPRFKLASEGTLSENQVNALYVELDKKGVVGGELERAAVFGLRLYKASRAINLVDRIASLPQTSVTNLINGIFDHSSGTVRQLSPDELKKLTEATRKEDPSSVSHLLHITESTNVQ